MKVNKALKRLAKIKALMSDVTKRFSVSAPHLREVLQGAEDAIARAKHAVSMETSSRTKATKAKVRRPAKRAASQKKPSVKTVAARAKAVEGSPRVKKAAKKRAAKNVASRPEVEAATQVAVH